MRADRLLTILLLLQIHKRLTSAELAQRLEVSERTIHRDMEALSSAGIPVFAERGSGGGWSLLGDYQTSLTGLKSDEILSLFLPQPTHLLADLGLEAASKNMFLKLLSTLPSASRQEAESMQQRIHIDTTGWSRSERGIAIIPQLQEALWQQRRLQISYQKVDGLVERVIDPLGLVAKGSAWYLVGMVEENVRTYRASRILSATLLAEPSSRPSHFNLRAYWEASAAQFVTSLPSYRVTLRAHQADLPRLRRLKFSRVLEESEADHSGHLQIVVDLQTFDHACESILSMATAVEVIEPLAVKERVVRLAEEIVRFYSTARDHYQT
ncbi:helix-turn-helix transcriptional regulator [Tumebacillus lipolyticus]|uniref:Helix-turn-helix transcriptional regulator n=1 Tax=Tumebacillus lipolyticus TaxID=1280370 RepID=A0ABW4ZWT4_9BACL